MFENKRVLTGVKPTGKPHIGNYFGAIKPAIELGNKASEHFMFIADYHAINAEKNPEVINQHSKEVASIFLACGVNPEHTHFYRQSDIPEVHEFTTILTAFTPKGWMNKAHAYKAQVDKNIAAGLPNDDGINMGLYTYPTLMAADILLFNADIVPVGKDQIQHVEIARDIAGSINANYGKEVLVQPAYSVVESVATIVGTDGRKMSKSYGNVVPMFEDDAIIKKAIFSIATDSRPIDEPKNPDEILIYEIYKSITTPDKIKIMAEGLEGGKLGYGHIKNMLLDEVLSQFKPMKEKYDYYMNNFDVVEEILSKGAEKVRPIARSNLKKLKDTVFGK